MKRIQVIVYIVAGVILLGVIVTGVVAIINRRAPVVEQSSGSPAEQSYTVSEVSTHSTKDDCWTIIDGSVYNLTSYVNRHPGGEEMLRACGNDATTLFDSRRTDSAELVGSGTPHSQNALEQLKTLKIGTVRK